MRKLFLVFFGVAFTLSSVAATTFVSSDGRFEYTLLEGNATLTKYLGEELISEIPSSLDGYRVVSLGKSAFRDKFRVPSSADDGVRIALSIPSTVTEIGDYTFSGCTRLESVTIPGSVKSIGAYAFKGCNGVTRVSFGEGLERIGRSAFSCSGTTSIEALHGTLKVVFPSTLKELGLTAFTGNQNLGEAVFLAPLEVTGDSAFVSCQYLTRVQFAEGQKEISEKMFRYCDELAEINFPGSLETIGDYSFERDGSLTAVSIPASVKTIGEYAFKDCEGLHMVSFGEGVESIGRSAFQDCTSLPAISIPGSVVSVGMAAFKDCSALVSITLGEGIREIGASAFALNGRYGYEKGGLRVVLPKSLQTVGASLFASNDHLEEIVFSSPVLSGSDTLEDMFSGCDRLRRVTLADGQEAIGEGMFMNCTMLEEITLPDTVESIGRSAFQDCTSLPAISIPGSVVSEGMAAFKDCSALVSITLGEGIREIGASAFSLSGRYGYEKGGLRVVLPSSLQTVGASLFASNDHLEEIVFSSPVLSGSDTLEDMFSGCDRLRRVTLADGQEAIGEGMFKNCTMLEEITLPDTVSSVGRFAFYACRSLADITLSSGLASIGRSAFSRCRSLREVALPAGVTEMEGWPFEKGTVVRVVGTSVPTGCESSGTVSVPVGDTAWRVAVAAAGGTIVEDIELLADTGLSMAQKAYCLASVQEGETTVRIVGDGATIAACDALGIAPKRTVSFETARAAGETVTLTFTEPRIEVVSCDFTNRTLTVRVVPGEGTSLSSAFIPSRFLAEGGPSLVELSQWRASAVSTAETDDELVAEEKAYVSSGEVTFALPDPGEDVRAAFWHAILR